MFEDSVFFMYYTLICGFFSLLMLVCIYAIKIVLFFYKEGYKNCHEDYKKHKKVGSFNNALSPYELGWNKAFEEIYNNR